MPAAQLTFARGIERCEEVDEESDQAQVSGIVFGDVETEARSKQSPRHLRKCKKKQCTTSVGVDCPDGRPCEHEVDQTKAKTCDEGIAFACARTSEDRRGVKRDDVDTTQSQVSIGLERCNSDLEHTLTRTSVGRS